MATKHEIRIPKGNETLPGILTVPPNARGLVIFAHGSGSSHRSPRNNFVASVLNDIGLATALCDLLTYREERQDAVTGELRFDIRFLAQRLTFVIDQLLDRHNDELKSLPIGLFGASTGAASALDVAAFRSDISAVVSRGGRPDLAQPQTLASVTCPVLLLVGSEDHGVIELNQFAFDALVKCPHRRLVLVPGATHLFEEGDTLRTAAEHAREWFRRWLIDEQQTHAQSQKSQLPTPTLAEGKQSARP